MTARMAVGLTLSLFVLLSIGCTGAGTDGHQNPASSAPEGDVQAKLLSTPNVNLTMPSTPITFSLPVGGFVHLEVQNATGYLVRDILNDTLDAGTQIVEWDLKNDDGQDVNTGLYLYVLQTSVGSDVAPVYVCRDQGGDCINE